MVTGSVATIAYGEPRLTVDVDLVVDLATDRVAEFRRAFGGAEFYCPSEEAIREELSRATAGHINVIHSASGLKADIYLKGGDPLHEWAFERRRRLDIEDLSVFFAPPEYVILRKLQYYKEGGSPKHVRDIRSVLAVNAAGLDAGAIASFSEQLGVRDLWDRIQESVGEELR